MVTVVIMSNITTTSKLIISIIVRIDLVKELINYIEFKYWGGLNCKCLEQMYFHSPFHSFVSFVMIINWVTYYY